MGRNKIKIERIKNERIRQVIINKSGNFLQEEKRTFKKSNGIVFAL